MIIKAERIRGLEPHLKSHVIGQDDAIARVSRALEAAECRLNNTGSKPRGAFLFMGPSGVGKTSTAKAFSEYLFGPSQLSILFMNEMQTPDTVPDLVKAISRGVSAHPDGTAFLFDEIEKAHRSIIDVFISLLDEGQITDADGSRISVANCYTAMTSNIGASRWSSMEQTTYAVMERFAYESAKRALRPELFNRLTEVIVYRPLNLETQIKILKNALDQKLQYIEPQIGKLDIDKSVHPHLLRKCFSQTGGARRLQQELDRQINAAVLPLLLDGMRPEENRCYFNPKRDALEIR